MNQVKEKTRVRLEEKDTYVASSPPPCVALLGEISPLCKPNRKYYPHILTSLTGTEIYAIEMMTGNSTFSKAEWKH